jgi:hypothetical protein
MHPLMRYRGEPVEIRDRDGRVYRGVIDWDPPPGGMFLRTSFGRRFIPFVAIVFVFSFRRRRRIFKKAGEIRFLPLLRYKHFFMKKIIQKQHFVLS